MSNWVLGLGTGVCLALMPGAVVLGAILLAPAVVAMMIDESAGKSASKPILLCGIATAVAPGYLLWTIGPEIVSAVSIATNPRQLALSWSLQGVAWLSAEVLPAIIRASLNAASSARIAVLRRARARIETEWSIPEVAVDPEDPVAT